MVVARLIKWRLQGSLSSVPRHSINISIERKGASDGVFRSLFIPPPLLSDHLFHFMQRYNKMYNFIIINSVYIENEWPVEDRSVDSCHAMQRVDFKLNCGQVHFLDYRLLFPLYLLLWTESRTNQRPPLTNSESPPPLSGSIHNNWTGDTPFRWDMPLTRIKSIKGTATSLLFFHPPLSIEWRLGRY